MSNFQQSPFEPKQRDEQETYYIQKARRDSKSSANPAPSVPPKDRKYANGGLSAPTAASHIRNQSAAYPALPPAIPSKAKSPSPARNPVGSHPRPTLDLSKAKAYQQRPTVQTTSSSGSAQTPLSSGGRTQQTIPLTHRDQHGKYHGQTYDQRPLPSFPIEQAFLPAMVSPSQTSPPQHSPPQSSPDSPARPTSSSSRWSFGAKKDQADISSDEYSPPPRPRSRAGSLTDKVLNGIANKTRRASQSLKEKTDIVRMDQSQREEFCAKHAPRPRNPSENSDDAELERQDDPRSRPFEQKQALLQKNKHLQDVVANTGSAMVEADYENMVATTEANRKINAAYEANYEQRRVEAILRGEDIPSIPRRMPTAELALTPSQRSSARISAGIVEEVKTPPKPELSTGDKVAVRLGKTFDKLHLQNRERAHTLESEMSFADVAVPGAMDRCSSCGETPRSVLRDGMCTRCRTNKKITTHQAAKSAMKETSASRFVGEQTVLQEADPDSPPWMRVAAQKKMRRVRRTVYADPGNPFAADDDARASVEFTSLPFKPVVIDTNFTHPRPSQQPDSPEVTCLLNGQPFDDASESPADGRVPFGSHPDDLLPPTPGIQSIPTLIKADRHVSHRALAEVQEASLRSSWQSHPASLMPGTPSTPRFRERDVRNTQFYGF